MDEVEIQLLGVPLENQDRGFKCSGISHIAGGARGVVNGVFDLQPHQIQEVSVGVCLDKRPNKFPSFYDAIKRYANALH